MENGEARGAERKEFNKNMQIGPWYIEADLMGRGLWGRFLMFNVNKNNCKCKK